MGSILKHPGYDSKATGRGPRVFINVEKTGRACPRLGDGDQGVGLWSHSFLILA